MSQPITALVAMDRGIDEDAVRALLGEMVGLELTGSEGEPGDAIQVDEVFVL